MRLFLAFVLALPLFVAGWPAMAQSVATDDAGPRWLKQPSPGGTSSRSTLEPPRALATTGGSS